jgi:hypothetical protein
MLSNDKQCQAQFKEWLQRTKSYSLKAAVDASGRAKRAERILGESLDDLLSRGLDATQIVALVSARLSQNPESQGSADRVGRELQLAVRHYLEFRRSP